MTLEYAAQAVTQARRLLDLPDSQAGAAWRVRRLTAPGAYFLVHGLETVRGHDVDVRSAVARDPRARPRLCRPARQALAGPSGNVAGLTSQEGRIPPVG